MNIGSVVNTDYSNPLWGIQATDNGEDSNGLSVSSAGFQTSGDQASISSMGKMMSTLHKLASTDPEKFKETAQKISDDLSAQAKDATDPLQAKMLGQMSSDFAQAAQTGSMDSLKPKGPPPPPPSGGAAAGNKGSFEQTMDEATSIIGQDVSDATGTSYSLDASALASGAGGIASNAAAIGSLMQTLSELQQSDPTKFKELTQKISDDLAAQAKDSSDPRQAGMLNKMSADFAQASKTGSMQSLEHSGRGHHHHHHHHGGAGQGMAQSQTGQDPMAVLKTILASDLSGLDTSTTAAAA